MMMLKKIKNISLFLACMVLLLHTVVPHHHHNNTTTLCINQLKHNACDDNNSCTSHHEHDNDNECDDDDCTIDDLYAPKDNHEIKYRLDIINISSFFYFIVPLVNLSLNDILKNKGSDFRREILALIFQNPHVNSIFGLRAPPQF
jgi:hypothetical protein